MLISVVMPAYNAERFIASAIASVQAQTYTNWEMIIVDDCSTDRTYQKAQQYAKKDSRIRVLQNKQNCGAAASRNYAFQNCRGEYIALLDSDDLWKPQKLEKQIQCAVLSGADIIYCSYGMIDEGGEKICGDFIVPTHTDFRAMLVRTVISCSTAMLSYKLVSHEQFSTSMYHEDLSYWLHLLKVGYVAVGIPDVLADYRQVGGSRASNKIHSAWNRWKIYRRQLHLPLIYSTEVFIQYMFWGLVKYKRQKT